MAVRKNNRCSDETGTPRKSTEHVGEELRAISSPSCVAAKTWLWTYGCPWPRKKWKDVTSVNSVAVVRMHVVGHVEAEYYRRPSADGWGK